MRKERTVSLKRTVTRSRTITIPRGFGIFPDDVLEFKQSNDGTITLVKLVSPTQLRIEMEIKDKFGI